MQINNISLATIIVFLTNTSRADSLCPGAFGLVTGPAAHAKNKTRPAQAHSTAIG